MILLNAILKTTLIGLFFGTFGTTIGGIIGVMLKKTSNKFLSFILSFASGLMIAIVCFELIPEALAIASLSTVLLGITIGIIIMMICDNLVDKKFSKLMDQSNVTKSNKNDNIKNNLLKTGIIVSIGLAIHNFPEGLAIGSGFEASLKLGISLAIAICFHDIPERNIDVCSHEKWGNVNHKSHILCHSIRYYNRNWSIFRSIGGRNITKHNSSMPIICSRSHDIHCIRRTNTRVKSIISRTNEHNRKYDRFSDRNICNEFSIISKKKCIIRKRRKKMQIFENETKQCISQMVEEKIKILRTNKEFNEKYISLSDTMDKLEKEITGEQKKLFEQMQELIYETESYYFALSYSLGVKYGEDLQKL